jgi:hypothetical protein
MTTPDCKTVCTLYDIVTLVNVWREVTAVLAAENGSDPGSDATQRV